MIFIFNNQNYHYLVIYFIKNNNKIHNLYYKLILLINHYNYVIIILKFIMTLEILCIKKEIKLKLLTL
jgi:hypothetical protein